MFRVVRISPTIKLVSHDILVQERCLFNLFAYVSMFSSVTRICFPLFRKSEELEQVVVNGKTACKQDLAVPRPSPSWPGLCPLYPRSLCCPWVGVFQTVGRFPYSLWLDPPHRGWVRFFDAYFIC